MVAYYPSNLLTKLKSVMNQLQNALNVFPRGFGALVLAWMPFSSIPYRVVQDQ